MRAGKEAAQKIERLKADGAKTRKNLQLELSRARAEAAGLKASRDEWRTICMKQHSATVRAKAAQADLAEALGALRKVRQGIIDTAPDTVWVGDAMTAVDCIDAILARHPETEGVGHG
jgi:hypothetical protein